MVLVCVRAQMRTRVRACAHVCVCARACGLLSPRGGRTNRTSRGAKRPRRIGKKPQWAFPVRAGYPAHVPGSHCCARNNGPSRRGCSHVVCPPPFAHGSWGIPEGLLVLENTMHSGACFSLAVWVRVCVCACVLSRGCPLGSSAMLFNRHEPFGDGNHSPPSPAPTNHMWHFHRQGTHWALHLQPLHAAALDFEPDTGVDLYLDLALKFDLGLGLDPWADHFFRDPSGVVNQKGLSWVCIILFRHLRLLRSLIRVPCFLVVHPEGVLARRATSPVGTRTIDDCTCIFHCSMSQG